MNSFGERLKIEREKKGYNQKEFAEAIGVTPTRLNYWEKDKREPDFLNIRKMIDILGCNADYLLGIKLSPTEMDITAKYNLLPLSERKMIDEVVNALLLKQIQSSSEEKE